MVVGGFVVTLTVVGRLPLLLFHVVVNGGNVVKRRVVVI